MLLLDRVDRELASHLLLEQLHISVSVIRMGHVCEAVADDLLTRIAHEVAMRLIGLKDTPVLVDFDDAHGRVVVGGPQPSLALPQRPLSFAQLLRCKSQGTADSVDLPQPWRGERYGLP